MGGEHEVAVQGVDGLIVVDAQCGLLCEPCAVPAADQLAARLADLVQRARRDGAVVVHVQNDGSAGSLDEPGEPGWNLVLAVEQSDRELVLRKGGDDSFVGTGLAEELERRAVRRVMVCGLLSEMCVSATARSALGRGFEVVIAHDGHGTFDLDEIPADVVARVAEHALGDQLTIVAHAAEVGFARALDASR